MTQVSDVLVRTTNQVKTFAACFYIFMFTENIFWYFDTSQFELGSNSFCYVVI